MPRILQCWSGGLLLLLAGVTSAAQGQNLPAPPALTLELELRAGNPGDSAVVRLDTRGRYYAEVAPAVGLPQLKPLHGDRAAFLSPVAAPPGAARYEVYPYGSGLHVVRVTGVPSGQHVTLRLWTDAAGSAAAETALRQTPARDWGIGVSAAVGAYGGYFVSDTESGVPAGGLDVEVALAAAGSGPLSADAGVWYQSRGNLGYSVLWFYFEPRFRLLTVKLLPRRSAGVGVLGRAAKGSASALDIDPTFYGAGLFFTQPLPGAEPGHGWSLSLSFLHGWIGNIPRQGQRQTNRLSLGLRWLR